MVPYRSLGPLLAMIFLPLLVKAQRTYAPNSVLSSGNWYKLSIHQQGVYSIDATFLSRMGISLPIPSAQIRLFGNGGRMLPEDNASPRPDDLQENAIWIDDGGDGSFSGSDHFLFFAPGPQEWTYDAAAGKYTYRKNKYADSAWYFLTIGGQGKRMGLANAVTASAIVTEYDEMYAYERDEVNFLSSGKEWYGEEFGSGPGRVSTREFSIPFGQTIPGSPVTIYTEVIGRSLGQPARFEVRLNGASAGQLNMPALSGGAYEPLATPASDFRTLNTPQSDLRLTFSFIPGSVNAQGWLNKFEVMLRRKLDMSAPGQLIFRDRKAPSTLTSAVFQVSNAPAGTRIWDVTDYLQPTEQTVNRSGSMVSFSVDCSRVREYVAFSPDRYLTPTATGRISNQDLHAPSRPGMVIITHPSLTGEARRIADFHLQQRGLVSLVADVQQVWNEFSSGTPDPTAIRDFVKMFYDRAGTDTTARPSYLLLFGDASFDYRNRIQGNTNLVPAYQSASTLDPLTTYTSDDFFGFLDDHEDINSLTTINYLDIGIGRIPASMPAEAKAFVDKLIAYAGSFGPWRNQMTLVADDEDQNLHLQDAEWMASSVAKSGSELNLGKIYLDAYPQESGAGGSRYPQVNEAINRRMFSGNLIWNYSGHGGNSRLAQEAILEADMLGSWQNRNKLPLFITATCDFAPYDDPLVRSLGEQVLLRDQSGAIALMTTTRLVFASANRIINYNYLSTALSRQPDGRYLSLGEAVKRSKNLTYQTTSDAINNRKFTLLGDPALTLGFPEYHVVTTRINDRDAALFTDTLRALNRYTFSGEVRDRLGRLIPNFQGTLYTGFYDKAQQLQTRANDPGSSRTSFEQQQNLIFNGKTRVENGRFSYTFIIPKDIDLRVGKGRLSYYADNGNTDASGLDQNLFVGGLGNGVRNDGEGPLVRAYLNDEKFVNGGIVNETPVLIVRLKDSSGLNTVGTGIGHDMIAVLDENTRQVFVLNDFYESESGSFQSGTIRFPLPRLEPGPHRIRIRVWDVFNNATEQDLECMVVKKEDLQIAHVLNYPNPFSTRTAFWFEHNRPSEDLQVTVRIMTITGKVVRTLRKTINTPGNRSDSVEWDGTDAFGDRLSRGIYLYQLSVRTTDGKSSQKLEKLVIL